MVPAVGLIRQSPPLASLCCACDLAPYLSDLPTCSRSSSWCVSAPACRPPTNYCRSDNESCFPPPSYPPAASCPASPLAPAPTPPPVGAIAQSLSARLPAQVGPASWRPALFHP